MDSESPEPVVFEYKTTIPLARRRQSAAEVMKANEDCVVVVFQSDPGDASVAAGHPSQTLLALPEDCSLASAVLEMKAVAGLHDYLCVTKVKGRQLRLDNEMGELYRVYKDHDDDILYLHYHTLPRSSVPSVMLGLTLLSAAASVAYYLYRRRASTAH